ncbi:hypothetical protein COW36_16205 [bacterium (Candidatus Blackallbacteria) CG17_big_fil_post_rev_8_21_14_2_50_48_46]|uniref:Fe2OG dioxygenase domain-containing protein n=1 Tax=bacterium (Candidatus Blackallbacteria) CG17_big_fil_post_rev_8_21_14_2_50_48_46 TaxID=2014261 RepID=A0A2M7G1R5_9BACT|nr:MAG: hypothetical protein COW64_16675 [bacterium (Candidatus Blackallbacteria) CG18_big_fil_WC_8_21_14_2_50_49_26]PIW15679.1 MAG: hypothetical protein COW36_16205 [bacterium (Candidatus Blackallbacteria) CG17_big_fil_post_rev_8_21_14_2_50_48_46]PIW48684.1 MAG: hypothetical protein COW20_08385 [bacterium (Candidatus Blackallbacteria) CG13_big_fil_rev_8_21_14_2_50_49_14]
MPSFNNSPLLDQAASWPGFLSAAECKNLSTLPNSFQPARVKDIAQDRVELRPQERKTQTFSILDTPETHWLYQRLNYVLNELNQRCFRFRIQYFLAPEVLKYEPNGFYAPHTDLGRAELSSRKLSAVTLLSDPQSFSGGELIFYPPQKDLNIAQGTLLLFPAWLIHEVRPVLTGERYSLVTWIHGPCFR